MYQRGDQHWESLVELFDRFCVHEQGVTGASYYEDEEFRLLGIPEGEDRPWCCEYEKKTFIDAWNEVEEMVKSWHHLDGMRHFFPDELLNIPSSLVYRSEY